MSRKKTNLGKHRLYPITAHIYDDVLGETTCGFFFVFFFFGRVLA